MTTQTLLLSYLIAINLIALITMGIDKRKAIKHGFRIPESVLFILALIGGSIGSILGMQLFRHKTRKYRFKIGMPLILALQIAGVLAFYFSFSEISFL
ncbi:MAG: DUF1294 domain-containing protein [Eubacteriales bacterium]|nr:DUF1294 domain-containing protein [Eubacteriales bacterium]